MKISIDDGCASDIRIAKLAEKYDIDCTFYWPVEWHSLAHDKGYEPLSFKDAGKIASKHTIGSHTITHRHLTQIPEGEAKYEISHSRDMLEDMLSTQIIDFAPPRGYTNDKLTKYTMRYYKRQRLTKGSNLVHIHPNSGANGNVPWIEKYQQLVDKGIEDIECWGHSWEFDKFNMWEEIKGFLREVSHT